MRFLFITLYTFILTGMLNAVLGQNSISGFVKNITTNEEIQNAHIFVSDIKVGTSTNSEGIFKIQNIEEGDYVLNISHIRYLDKSINISCPVSGNLEIFLKPDSIQIASYVVTATRTNKRIEEIPLRVSKLSSNEIESYPASNTDNLLKMIPGLNVNRSWGIFSRNASVTMRGLPGSSRSLILLDGIPLNKTAGGTVNWHLISPDEIESIEVVKGPGSSLYGMNSMAGTINIITRKPGNKINGMFNLGYGTYNTIKSLLRLSGSSIKNSKGFYYRLGGFYRQGDGYILETEDTRDSLNTEAYLKEGNINAMLGYQFNENSKLELDYRYYHDTRGSGVKVFEEDGSCESFTDHNFRLGYTEMFGKYSFNMQVFNLYEFYYRQNENINSSGEYKLVDTETDKQDIGVWMSFSRFIGKYQQFTFGLDVKNGILDNQEIYRTSTDQIYTDGNLLFTGLFAQDEFSLVQEKLKLIAGLRMDLAQFYNGHIKVSDPTSKTGFPEPIDESFDNTGWAQVSPKLAAKYFFRKNLDLYASASYGFMPPKLDDLVGSRKIRRGFKKANPELTPERLISFEIGSNYSLKEKLIIKPSVFYSLGDDFQYLVATGEFIDSDSDEPVTVYQRQNISEVLASGFELGMEYYLFKNITFTGSYAYNYSKITDYNSSGDLDLTGKYLNEVPKNLVFLGFNWRNKIVDVFVDYTFTDDQWYDEENTVIIYGYSLVNLRLSKKVLKHFLINLDIQDLFDEQFVDRKGYLSPGRFFMFEIKYLIN